MSNENERTNENLPEENRFEATRVTSSADLLRADFLSDQLVSFLTNTTKRYSLSVADIELVMDLLYRPGTEVNREIVLALSKVLEYRDDFSPEGMDQDYLANLHLNRKFRYRPHYYHFRQHSAYTCGIVCYLMAANVHTSELVPSKRQERTLYNELADEEGLVSTIALMRDAASRGLYVRACSDNNYLDIEMDDERAESLRRSFVALLESPDGQSFVRYSPSVDLNADYIRDQLYRGEMMLMNGTVGGNIPHMRLVGGYHGESMLVSDPLENRIQPQQTEILEANIQAPLGKFGFSVSSKPFNFYGDQEI